MYVYVFMSPAGVQPIGTVSCNRSLVEFAAAAKCAALGICSRRRGAKSTARIVAALRTSEFPASENSSIRQQYRASAVNGWRLNWSSETKPCGIQSQDAFYHLLSERSEQFWTCFCYGYALFLCMIFSCFAEWNVNQAIKVRRIDRTRKHYRFHVCNCSMLAVSCITLVAC